MTSPILENIDQDNLKHVIAGVRKVRAEPMSASPFSVYFLNNFTLSPVAPFLDFHGLKSALDVQVGFGKYNVLHQELMDLNSDLHRFSPGLLVLSLMYEAFAPTPSLEESVCARLNELFHLAEATESGRVVVNSFLMPMVDNGTGRKERVRSANNFIRNFVEKNPSKFFLCDWNRYVQEVGRQGSIDQRFWYMAKAPFKPQFLTRYAADIIRISLAAQGRNKKCLVLDCDGTLWGGVVGEDGPEGIALHSNDYPGNIFFEIQRMLLELQQSGTILALCSKNNERDVLSLLSSHEHCLLKPESFSAHQINWGNKAQNIAKLAQNLNIGLDSLVFLDDNPFEVEMVRSQLPEVNAMLVPKRLASYPDYLAQIINRFFYAPNRTSEDSQRTQYYQARVRAEEAKQRFGDIEAYLESLDIVGDMHPMRPSEAPRVSQLTQKTNQFNLNKHVLSEAEVENFSRHPDHSVQVMVVSDKFGHLGLTNVCIVEQKRPDEVLISTFLMSCRVFERNLEYAFLDYVLQEYVLQDLKDVTTVRAIYRNSGRNGVAENFYDRAGFSLEKSDEDGRYYVLDLSTYEPKTFDYIRRI